MIGCSGEKEYVDCDCISTWTISISISRDRTMKCIKNKIVPVHYMLSGMTLSKQPNYTSTLSIYCYKGGYSSPLHLYSTIVMQFKMQSKGVFYTYYQGSNPEEVMRKCEEEESSWTPSKNFFGFNSQSDSTVIHTFDQECVGIKTSDGFTAFVDFVYVDLSKVGTVCLGILLVFLAARLSRNEMFFYICGTLLGISSSLLIIVYFASKLIPKKTLMVGAIVGSWSASLFVMRYLLKNFQYILNVYFNYVLSYILGAGLISFAVCYRMGLPTNPRSKNLIQWALQGCGLCLIWYSSNRYDMKYASVFLVLVVYKFSTLFGNKFKTFWLFKYPQKRRLLSEEEYIEQGTKETKKALENLKRYCSSPDCNQWKTVMHVKNPRRFAEFMNGAPHVSTEELLAHEAYSRSIQDDLYTDDSSDSDAARISEEGENT
ncbi:nuclear envelope integral membrane protein isoform X1 [Bacillus rossius redtenbacheri]|uniref:nuclear envelope integral membrane protein isoform X1 n=1 Tax=Bacillus rossius redtenbacheri TaxID=93214 RepID=UPI002FDD6C7F